MRPGVMGHGEGVGGVGRARGLGETELHGHHSGDLRFSPRP